MAISVNRIIIVGRVGSDPEQSGRGPVKFSVATSRSWKDKSSGERKEVTQWHKVVVWNEAAQKYALDYVNKGDLVYVEGEMEHRVWEKDDEKINIAEVVVHPYSGVVQAMPKDGKTRSQDDSDERPSGKRQTETERRRESERGGDFGRGSGGGFGGGSRDLDDDIPFAPEWR